MARDAARPRFQDALDVVERLDPEDQEFLVQIIRKRLVEARRAELADDVKASREAYRRGEVRRGTAEDAMAELGE